MTNVISLDQIKSCLQACSDNELISLIEVGFVAYSKDEVVVPPVGYLPFTNPSGDVHIKYGYINDDDFYVIKIASGFYENPKLGLNSSNGLMLVFNKKTGELASVLLDEGHLTDVRTALAGAVVAKHLAPPTIEAIGIIGTGIQGRLQLRFLRTITACRKVFVWGRTEATMADYKKDLLLAEFMITPTATPRELAQHCNLIITTTPAKGPLLRAEDLLDNVHITAVGADAPGKQELDSRISANATTIVVDSIAQCIDHGEVCQPIKEGKISADQLVELGAFISNGKKRSQGISIADLTGVAVQDIQIAKFVHQKIAGR